MDIISYSLSKKIAASAVSGVKSMSVSGQTLTINTKDSGVLTMTFPTPKDGVSVTDIDVNANNQIVFTMSDGTEFISGKIPTVKGDKGDPFKYSDFTQEQLDSLKGSDGFSPSAKIEKVGDTATITITDKDGTTTATIKDGQGGSGGTADVPIEKIKVNGELQTPVNKVVDITVPSIEGLTKDADLATVAKSGSYNDLADKPTIPSLDGYAKTSEIPSKVSELENDSNYLSSIPEEYVTETELSAKGFLTEHQDISGKVDKVEGKSLISDTEIARLATVDNYDDTDIRTELANKADATAIPSKVSELTNDSNYQTAEQVNSTVTTEIAKVVADAPEDLNTLKEMSDWIAGHEDDASAMNSAISDNKTSITALQTGKADKSEIPTTVAELTDSDDYAKKTDLHSHDNKSVLDGITSDKVTYWDNKSEFSGSYNDLNDKPTIDAELSNTSENAIQNKVVTKEINKLYSDISFNDFDTATSGTSFTDAEDGNMLVTDWTKNLLNPTVETCEVNGITCTNNGDGTYTLNGTANENSTLNFVARDSSRNFIKKFIGKKLKFIYIINEVEQLGKSYMCIGQSLSEDWVDWGAQINNGESKTISDKIFGIVCDLHMFAGDIFNNVLIKPMLTTDLSTTYDDFVPYSGYEIKSCGKNLMSVNDATNGDTLDTEARFNIRIRGLDKGNIVSDRIHLLKNEVMKGHQSFTFKVTIDEPYGIAIKHNGSTNDINIEYINYMVRKGTYTISFDVASNNPSVKSGLLLHNIQLERGSTETGFEPYQNGGTVHIDSMTEFPLFGLKSFDGITNIISPGNVKCVYPTNESGKGVLDSLYNKDKMLTEQNKNLEVLGKCKNLLNPTLQTTTQNGVTCTNNGDGTYTLNGTASGDAWFTIENIPKFEDKIYKIVGFKNPTDSYYTFINAVRKLDEFVEFSKLHEKYNPTAYLSNDVYKGINIGIAVTSGTTLTNEIVKPMLTTDLNATYDDFVPYTGEGETLTHDVAEIKNDLGGMVTKQGHFGSNKTDFTLENLYEGFQQFMITTLYRATGEPNDCDGYIIIHKESSSGIKSFKVYGASGVTVSYDSSSNKITLTTTKPYMSLYVTSNKNFDIV